MATGSHSALEIPPLANAQPTRKLRLVELCFVVFFGTFNPYISTLYALTHSYKPIPGDMNFRLAQMICYELSTLGLVTYILYKRNSSWRAIGFHPKFSDLIVGFGLFVSGLLLMRIVATAYYLSFRSWTGEAPHFRDIGGMLQIQISLVWVIFTVVNGFFEEGVVRAFVMTDLVALTRWKWVAVLFSVVLQTGYHFYQGPSNVVVILPLFLLYALYFARTRQVFPLILAHVFQDLAVLLYHK
jgi:membrane protease YdiL (CAAX protease family)